MCRGGWSCSQSDIDWLHVCWLLANYYYLSSLVKPFFQPDISLKMSAPSSLSLMNLRVGKKIKVLVIILTNNAAFDRGN